MLLRSLFIYHETKNTDKHQYWQNMVRLLMPEKGVNRSAHFIVKLKEDKKKGIKMENVHFID